MTRILDREKALQLRLQGLSYSQIRERLNVGKGTLSAWLRRYPLSAERMHELIGNNEIRIERCRNTKSAKRQARLDLLFEAIQKDLRVLSPREMRIAGLFLYWGEGTKAARGRVELTNTDPAMLKFFVEWMRSMNVSVSRLKAKLHLYSDMNIDECTDFWSRELGIEKSNFRKPYIKTSTLLSLTYKNGFNHGTCSVSCDDSKLHDEVMLSLQYLRKIA